jgi:predicted metalloprotease
LSTPYGYGVRPQDRPGPPPGVLPPPQASPWQQQQPPVGGFPPPQQSPYGGQPGEYGLPSGQYGPPPGQWARPYYGGPNQFNGLQPQRRKSGAARMILLGFMMLAFLGIALATAASALTGSSTNSNNSADPGVVGPSIVPTPTTHPEQGSADDILVNAPVYRAGGLGQVDCPAEKLGNGSLAAQKVYYQELFKCLNDAWRPVFEKLGDSKPDPGLVVFDKPVNTPCGAFKPMSGRVLAFYCYGNQVMYTDVKQMNKAFGSKQDLAYLMTIAHEYGHHVQGVTGLFYARAVYLQDHPEQKLESSRRNELQASCFAGVFSKAVEQSYPLTGRLEEFEYQASNSFGESPSTPEDQRTHGLSTSQGFWIMNGFNIGETKACDTFAAPVDLVK